MKKILGMIAEVGIRVLWDNYCYDFGGRAYKQSEGGPIGQRPTMAASRLIMEDFFIEYEEILRKAELIITLLKVYVDDGRQVTSLLRKGMRFRKEDMMFEWDADAEKEDEEMERILSEEDRRRCREGER